MLYGGLGLFLVIIYIHGFILSLLRNPLENDYISLSETLIYIILGLLIIFSGLFIYIARFPEKKYPGTFDIIG